MFLLYESNIPVTRKRCSGYTKSMLQPHENINQEEKKGSNTTIGIGKHAFHDRKAVTSQ